LQTTNTVRNLAKEHLRQAQGLFEPNRLRYNLLGSQPMCFNLWAQPTLFDRPLDSVVEYKVGP
jgi:hypothetical protein